MSITQGQDTRPVITVSNLHKRFNLEAGFFAALGRYVNAVNGVSFSIGRNEAYGLVGESGCGKTTTARLLVRMYEADEGEIIYRNFADENIQGLAQDVRKLKGQDFKRYRERVKYIFQDPARSLNPRMTVFEVLGSGVKWSTKKRSPESIREEAAAILEEVGLSAADLLRRPAEFSGGQRQRISIARGLLMNPDLLICDEVVSALDVSIQGQILNLLLDLRSSRKSPGREISFLFIAHDLKVASYFCDRIGVMYRGEMMEEAPATELWKNHQHPYTELLFSSINRAGESPRLSPPQQGADFPNSLQKIEGCSFASRCRYAEKVCFMEKPQMKAAGAGHFLRCLLRNF
jgi:oligopeptide/dipeptide ABC transporter ATP-binding protein